MSITKLKKKKEANKGITLIALVITIIVLLILAGVSIATLMGDNGILTKTNDAKIGTTVGEEKEQIGLAYNAARTKKISKENKEAITADELQAELTRQEVGATANQKEEEENKIEVTFTKTNNRYVIDGSNGKIHKYGVSILPSEDIVIPGKKVTESNKEYTKGEYTAIIPVDFAIVPGCEDISEGLVISDNESDTEIDENNIVAEGNQFVWIPVTEETYKRNTSYAEKEVSEKAYTDNGYLPDTIQQVIQENIDTAEEIGTKTKNEVIGDINEEAEKKAVIPKKGFYIARYEMSVNADGKPQSKKGKKVLTGVPEKTRAKTFINSNNVKSALISGIQWDATMAFISKEPRVDGNGNIFDVTKQEVERHTGSLTDSGANKADKVCNIYDLEGNYYERVAERNSYYSAWLYTSRGGSYIDKYSASNRGSGKGGAGSGCNAYRFVLYVM